MAATAHDRNGSNTTLGNLHRFRRPHVWGVTHGLATQAVARVDNMQTPVTVRRENACAGTYRPKRALRDPRALPFTRTGDLQVRKRPPQTLHHIAQVHRFTVPDRH